ADNHRHGRLVDGNRGNRNLPFDVGNRLADRDVPDAGEADDVAGSGFGDVDPLQAVEGEQLRDLRRLDGAVQLADGDGVTDFHAAGEDSAARNPSELIVRIKISDQE